MTLSAGARLGPYEILSALGSGGMGQVYLARDERLAREVALKVLPEDVSSDPARLRRFENEARSASALNHPNIVTIYDAGTSGSLAWIAMERVDGKTLRELLSREALPIRKLLPVAVQIAEGLATAHEAGIVHRDLKPENVMVTKDGLVKVLDFGVAKLAPTGSDGSGGRRAPVETATFPGTVVGTIAYMSPEQAAGQPLDFRSDQFSFGSLLYEMATGKRAFQGKSAVDTLAAVLKEDPRPIAELSPGTPAPLRWIIERCLAKEPGRRYASTRDLARDLETLRDHSSETSGAALISTPRPRRLRVAALLTAATVLAALGGVYLVGRRSGGRPVPDFQRLTFRRGAVASARFAPDGRTIVYGAAWDGDPIRLFSTRTDGRESRRLDLPDGELASLSSLGEIAMLVGDTANAVPEWTGTLARVPLTGGAPRMMNEGVRGADWSLDGKSLVVVRDHEGKWRIEFPIGKVVHETEDLISCPRLSPRGDRIAFWTSRDLSSASVETVDLAGKHSVLAGPWKRGGGLAWSPDGREVWFSANQGGWQSPLYAVTPSGQMRVVTRLPSWIELRDVFHDGRVLMALARPHANIRAATAGETQERDLSWHEGSLVKGLTPDGKTMLFDEEAEGDFHVIYVRPTDGSPATRIGEGRSLAISPDGLWVAANARGRGSPVVLLPTGPGEPRVLDEAGEGVQEAAFFPDGKRLLIDGKGVIDLQTGKAGAGAPEGVVCQAFSPAGAEMACLGPAGEGVIWTLEGAALRPIPGFLPGENVMQWSSDGRSLYVGHLDMVPLRVFRLDLTTGKRELWHEFRPTEAAALAAWTYYFSMTPDARAYAYSTFNIPSDLYLVTGLE